MNCSAIIECSKRSQDIEHKAKLIEFLEKFSIEVLEYCDIDKTSEMYAWNGTDWINNIKQNNPIITDDILDCFENILNDEFRNYASEKFSIINNFIYELCGVYWHLEIEDNDDGFIEFHTNGPSTDKDWIMGFMP